MGCGESMVKYLMFIVNFVFALAGISLLTIGIIAKVHISGVTDNIDVSQVNVGPYTAIILGALIFLVAFLGCCGAINENRCMLITFAVILTLLMIISTTIGILIFVKKGEVQEAAGQGLEKLFEENKDKYHEIEKSFQCCGTNGASSYPLLNAVVNLPESCCPPSTSVCNAISSYEGCVSKLNTSLDKYAPTIAAIFIAVAAAMLVSVVYACCLASHFKNKQYYRY